MQPCTSSVFINFCLDKGKIIRVDLLFIKGVEFAH